MESEQLGTDSNMSADCRPIMTILLINELLNTNDIPEGWF